MKKTKIIRKFKWNDVNITVVKGDGKTSEFALKKMVKLNEFLDKMPPEKREKFLNGEH